MSLGLGIFHAQAQSNPTEVLERAVSQIVVCEFKSKKFTIQDDETRTEEPANKNEKGAVGKLSLPLLLKKGRHEITFGVSKEADPKKVIVIDFSPRSESERLPADPDADADYDKVMSAVKGSVWIDRMTGELTQVTFSLFEPVPITRGPVKVVEIKFIDATVEQKFKNGKWILSTFNLELKLWHRRKWFPLAGKDLHQEYHASFDCK